jgi:hypothetical protein
MLMTTGELFELHASLHLTFHRFETLFHGDNSCISCISSHFCLEFKVIQQQQLWLLLLLIMTFSSEVDATDIF